MTSRKDAPTCLMTIPRAEKPVTDLRVKFSQACGKYLRTLLVSPCCGRGRRELLLHRETDAGQEAHRSGELFIFVPKHRSSKATITPTCSRDALPPSIPSSPSYPELGVRRRVVGQFFNNKTVEGVAGVFICVIANCTFIWFRRPNEQPRMIARPTSC